MRRMIGIALSALLAAPGCDATSHATAPAIVGSGVMKEESREVATFDGVDLSGAFEATVTIGGKPSVTLSADDNLLPMIKTEVREGRLEVGFGPGLDVRTKRSQKVAIVVPSWKALAARGASKISATTAEGATIEVKAEGASSVELKGISDGTVDAKIEGASSMTLVGKGKRLTLEVSGASRLSAGDASFESAKVSIEGACSGKVGVTGSIEGEVGGASFLIVLGNPTTRSVKTSGASKVSY